MSLDITTLKTDFNKTFGKNFNTDWEAFDKKFENFDENFKKSGEAFDKNFTELKGEMKEMHEKGRTVAKTNYCISGLFTFFACSTVGLALTAGALYLAGNALAVTVGIAAIACLTIAVAIRIFSFFKKFADDAAAEKDFAKVQKISDRDFFKAEESTVGPLDTTKKV